MNASGIDPAKVQALKDREDASFAETHAASIEIWHRAGSVMPNGVPDVVAANLLRPPADLGRRREGGAVPRRRRQRVRRLQHRRHVDVRRLRPGTGRRSGLEPHRRRVAVPPAERGLDLGGDRARTAIRVAEVAVHPLRHPREHRGDQGGAGRDRARQGPLLRGEVPRAFRRDARPARARRAGPGGSGAAQRRHLESRDRAVQRPRRPAGRPREPRDRDRDHRTGTRRTTSGFSSQTTASTTGFARSPARPGRSSPTTRHTRRSSVPAASRGCGVSRRT